MAREPATPSLVPLAPEVAPTVNVLEGISPFTPIVGAVTLAVPPREATLLALVTPIATAAPTPVPGIPVVVEPSAVVVGFIVALEVRPTGVVEETVPPVMFAWVFPLRW